MFMFGSKVDKDRKAFMGIDLNGVSLGDMASKLYISLLSSKNLDFSENRKFVINMKKKHHLYPFNQDDAKSVEVMDMFYRELHNLMDRFTMCTLDDLYNSTTNRVASFIDDILPMISKRFAPYFPDTCVIRVMAIMSDYAMAMRFEDESDDHLLPEYSVIRNFWSEFFVRMGANYAFRGCDLGTIAYKDGDCVAVINSVTNDESLFDEVHVIEATDWKLNAQWNHLDDILPPCPFRYEEISIKIPLLDRLCHTEKYYGDRTKHVGKKTTSTSSAPKPEQPKAKEQASEPSAEEKPDSDFGTLADEMFDSFDEESKDEKVTEETPKSEEKVEEPKAAKPKKATKAKTSAKKAPAKKAAPKAKKVQSPEQAQDESKGEVQ